MQVHTQSAGCLRCQHERHRWRVSPDERAGTLGFRCVKDLEVPPACRPGQAVCGRWSGPPHAFTQLAQGAPLDWARWHVVGSSVETARPTGTTAAIGAIHSLCTGMAATKTAGVSCNFTGNQENLRSHFLF